MQKFYVFECSVWKRIHFNNNYNKGNPRLRIIFAALNWVVAGLCPVIKRVNKVSAEISVKMNCGVGEDHLPNRDKSRAKYKPKCSKSWSFELIKKEVKELFRLRVKLFWLRNLILCGASQSSQLQGERDERSSWPALPPAGWLGEELRAHLGQPGQPAQSSLVRRGQAGDLCPLGALLGPRRRQRVVLVLLEEERPDQTE